MQYTIRKVPERLDRALRQRARRQGKSLNQVTLEALVDGMGLGDAPVQRRDLSDIVGAGYWEPEVDRALEEQRTIDPELWE